MASPKIVHELEIRFGNEYGPEEEQVVLEVLRKGAPTSGDACVRFEAEFAEYCGTRHARCVTNGTAALFLSLIAVDVKPGDVVLTTPITWIATAAAGVTLGANVDFVDVDPATYNMDPAKLEETLQRYPPRGGQGGHPCAFVWPMLRHGRNQRAGRGVRFRCG